GWNYVSSIGSYIGGVSALIFLLVVFRTLVSGKKCADNPWGEGATTLEWTLPSPPPFHTFETQPVIK
ncbi:MAG: cytochrome c oxidase subunit I, partial [Rickettsiales bacterium]|nr:cytochrome c oxidase subunit I [Rickettsiales bacterium]